MKTKNIFALSALLLIGSAYQVVEANANISQCVACHGQNGRAVNSLWPNLAGQNKDYIIKQLNDFRSGARKDPLMSPIAESLNPADFGPIAEYYSNLK